MGSRQSLALLLLVSAAPLAVGSSVSEDSFIGLWGAEHVADSAVGGELTVELRDGDYRAQIAGFTVPAARDGEKVRFSLAGDRGEFRGTRSADSKTITGHWIQPAGLVSFQARATFVKLLATRSGSCTGRIVPLSDSLHIYLHFHHQDGKLVATIRIPENNWLAPGFDVTVDHSDLLLSGPRGQVRGSFDERAGRLLIPIVSGKPPDVFTRRNGPNADGFYARVPSVPYNYRKPDAISDGWTTASAEDAGLDPAAIRTFVQSILDADPSAQTTFPIHSLLIARHGKLAVEEYFRGFTRDRPHDTRSAGKTFAPLLVGIARDLGAKIEPDMLVSTLLPSYVPFANSDLRKASLTLEHIMTMTSGLACDDNDPASPGREDRMQSQTGQRDWYKYTLDLPMVREPGGVSAVYCSADLNLVGGVAEAAAGMWNGELFSRYVAQPLAFGRYYLNLMPTGPVYTGGGVYLRPRDELKLGQLYLNGGTWNGVRVISKEWVERSTAPHATFARAADFDINHRYGYGWHIHDFAVNGRTYREYAAEGNGGQLVMVFPDLDMVVAINAGAYGSPMWYRWALETIPKYVIPVAAR
jgi:CubicO group peptidase (beta-lactamase class C family)